MNGFRLGLTLASIAALGACSADASKVIIANPGPLAYIRFVNAISDSGSQDWRFVDAVEGSPNALGLPFRGIFPGTSYQSAAPGSRHLRVFQSSLDPTFADPTKTTPGIVSTIFVDSTFTLVAGTHYTIMAVGTLRAPRTAKFVILTDNYTDPAANVAVRVVNAGVSGTLDVYGSATGGTTALPSSPLVAALASFAASTWANLPPGALALRANDAGSKTLPAMVDATAPAGVAAARFNLTAIAEAQRERLHGVHLPSAVTGSLAAQVVAGDVPRDAPRRD